MDTEKEKRFPYGFDGKRFSFYRKRRNSGRLAGEIRAVLLRLPLLCLLCLLRRIGVLQGRYLFTQAVDFFLGLCDGSLGSFLRSLISRLRSLFLCGDQSILGILQRRLIDGHLRVVVR